MMLFMWRFVIALGALVLLPGAALAQDPQAKTLKVEIEGKAVSVPAPFGYCDLDTDQTRDRDLVSGLDRLPLEDRVLRRMAPCAELKSWRSGQATDPIEIVQFLTAPRLGNAGEDRRAFLRNAVKGETLGRARTIERARQGFPEEAKETTMATIGLVERNDRAAVVVQAVMMPVAAVDRRMLVVSATTTVGPAPLVIQVISPYDNGSEVEWMLRDAREHVDRLLSANGEASRRFRDNRPPVPSDTVPGDVATRKTRVPRERTPGFFDRHGGYIALGLLLGGAALIAVGLLVARRLRPTP
jgi:hypothetical protein